MLYRWFKESQTLTSLGIFRFLLLRIFQRSLQDISEIFKWYLNDGLKMFLKNIMFFRAASCALRDLLGVCLRFAGDEFCSNFRFRGSVVYFSASRVVAVNGQILLHSTFVRPQHLPWNHLWQLSQSIQKSDSRDLFVLCSAWRATAVWLRNQSFLASKYTIQTYNGHNFCFKLNFEIL